MALLLASLIKEVHNIGIKLNRVHNSHSLSLSVSLHRWRTTVLGLVWSVSARYLGGHLQTDICVHLAS